MKWTVILAGGAFVLALAGSTAFVMLRTPAPAHEPAAAAQPPAAAKAATPRPRRRCRPRPRRCGIRRRAPRRRRVTPAPVAVTAGTDGARAPEVTPVAPAPSRAAPAAAPPAITPADYASVAKILTGMKPVAAGEILKRLDDEQVEGILRSLGARQASTMLGLLPPERGAVLSRRLMKPSPGGAR